MFVDVVMDIEYWVVVSVTNMISVSVVKYRESCKVEVIINLLDDVDNTDEERVLKIKLDDEYRDESINESMSSEDAIG